MYDTDQQLGLKCGIKIPYPERKAVGSKTVPSFKRLQHFKWTCKLCFVRQTDLVVPRNRMRGNTQIPNHRKVSPSHEKNCFTLRVTMHWSRLSRETVESLPEWRTFMCPGMTLSEQGGWTRWSAVVPPKPTQSMVRWSYENITHDSMIVVPMAITNLRGKKRQKHVNCDNNVGLMLCNLLSSKQVFYTAKLEQGTRV